MPVDLLALCADLVGVASVSHHESELADRVQAALEASPSLGVVRLGDNVAARTDLGRPRRLILAGHLDTVPPDGNEGASVDGETVRGVGSADMKGGLAVLLALADVVREPEFDVTFIFYACEEVDVRFNGLRQVAEARPELLEADAAIVCEPTGGVVEAGCQGTLRMAVTLAGSRAHTARAWVGTNAVHRLGPLLERVGRFNERRPVLDGCTYREALQAVRVEGGVANNVVPDSARVVLNHRFAPDRSAAEAESGLRAFLAPVLDEGDSIYIEDVSEPAPPNLAHPLLARLVELSGGEPRAKLGWTDVSFFAARGVPAANFGPGDPLLAHTRDEHVGRQELEGAYSTLSVLLGP